MAFSDYLKKYREAQASQSTNSYTSEEKSEQTTSGNGGSGNSFRDSLQRYRESQVSTITLEDWDKSSRELLTYTKDRASNWFDKSEYESLYTKYTTLLSQADGWRRKYSGNDEAISYIDSVASALGEAKKITSESFRHYAKWNNAEDYTKDLQEYQKQQKEYNDLLNLDQAAFKKEIDVYRSAKEEMRTLMESISEMQDIRNQEKYTRADIAAADTRYKELEQKYGYWDEIDDVISEKERYLRNAQRIQEGVRLSSVNDPTSKWYDPYFKKFTGYVSTESDGVWSNLTSQYGLGYDDLTYEYINGAENGMREEIIHKGIVYNSDTSLDTTLNWKVYDHMHDDEIAIYNYYYGKDGKEAADKYLDSIKETLNMRAATERFRAMEGKTAQELLFAVEAGLDQFDSGIKNLFSKDDYIPASSTQMLSGMVRTDLEDNGPNLPDWLGGASLGQVGYDTITTTANMAPSILTSMVLSYIDPTLGQAVGNALLGGSAAGNAYQEKLNLGYSQEEARTYGLMVGTSEAVLQYFLGGIGSLGKNGLSKTALKNLDAVDNVFARFAKSGAGKVLLSAGSEALEEGLQAVIEPYLWKAVSEEEVSVDWQEALYSALLGFATGGMFEAGSTAINTASTNAKYRADGSDIMSVEGGTDYLMNLANEVAGVTGSKTLSKQIDKVNRRTTEKNVGKLYDTVKNTNNRANAPMNQHDIAISLVRKGINSKTAMDIADALVESYNGNELTLKQKRLLKSMNDNQAVQDAVSNIMENPESTMGQRNQNVKKFATDIALGMLAKEAGVDIDAIKNNTEGNLTTTYEIASESDYEVSVDGKTVNNVTGEEIELNGLVQAEDGSYRIAVSDAESVSSSEVSYADKNQALVYETFVNLEKYSGETNRVIADMNLNSRNELIGLYNPNNNKDGGTFVKGVLDAYFDGHQGIDMATARENSPMFKLSPEQRAIAWNTGRADGIKSTTAAQSNVDTVYAEAKKVLDSGKAKKGDYRAILADGITVKQLRENEKHMAVYQLADKIAQSVQTKIRVYDGVTKEQGFYNHKTDEICLNLNAANTGREAIMAFTLAHELVHRAKKGSPAKYQAFVDFLMKEYGKQGSDVEAMIAEQIRAAERFNKTVPDSQKVKMTREKALEEVVSDACQRMLLDTNAGQKLAEFGAQSKQNKGFLADLKKWISELMTKLRNFFKNVEPDSLAAKEFAKFDANVKQILADMYVDMSMEAGEKLSTIKAAFGSDFAKKLQGLHDISYNLAAVDTHKTNLQKGYSEDSSTDLDTIMKRYDKIIDIWTRLGGELNSKFLADWNSKVGKDRSFTIFKAQAGYKYNVELSSMCKKGVPLFEAIDTIVKKEVMKELEIDVLGKAEKEILYDILKQHHFEIPCAICYVEQARQREGVIIDAFLNGKVETDSKGRTTNVKLGWNQVLDSIEKEMKANGVNYSFAQVSRDIATEKYTPANMDMDSKTHEAFLAALKKVANQEIARYNKAGGKSRKLLTDVTPAAVTECFKGSLPANLKIFKVLFEEPSSRFKFQKDLLYSSLATQNLSMLHNKLYGLFNSQGGVSGYKTKQGTTIYWGDILGKSWKPDTLRNEGGVRNQSNSDFQMFTLLDQAQMYLDFTAKGYYLQAYTKVLSELKLFGLSRGKINASLIPKVVVYRNADGSVDVEKTMANAGLDENGNPIYDDIEGINHDEAFMLIEDPEYSKSICGICIGYSDAHINKLLDDPRVQQIIGFHDKTDDGSKRYKGARYAKNYNGLNEAVNKEGKTVHIGFNPYVKRAEKKFQFNAETETYEGAVNYNGKTYTADDIPRLATDLYLEMCAKKEYTPAYKDFAGHPNYYKLLADFGLYDSQGHYAPHRKVVYNMPDTVPYLDADGNRQTMKTYDYIKAELTKELAVRDSISEALADTSDEGIIPQFKEAVKKSQEEKSFSLSKTVEESADLLAYHNITAKLLLDALNRNSLIMPSLAVTNKGMTDFGDISLLFDKSTIDPSANEQNKLYGADAWTPTQTQLKKNAKFDVDKTVRAVNTMKNRIGMKYVGELLNITPKQFKDAIINADGSIYDAYAHNIGVQTAYARETGIISKIPTRKDGTLDMVALKAQLNTELDTDNGWRQYKKWLNNISDTIITSYDNASNEDIIKNMKAQPATAKPFKLTENGELVVPVQEYSTIDDARKNKHRLSENAAEATKAVADEFLSFAKGIGGNTKAVVNAINIAFNSRYSTADIVKTFNRQGIKISTKNAVELQSLYKKAVELPTQYFEAKPGREVGLDEIKAVIIPENAPAELKQELESRGISTVEYDGTDASRIEKLNSMEDLMFSLPKGPYSYETLISKPDMVVTTVGGNVPKNRADVAHLAKKNATNVGKFDPKTGSVSVHVDDIDTDVILSTKGLRHGLRRTQDPLSEPNYIVTVKAGEILKNSIRINEITPSDENANSSYVLIGVARDTNGIYVVRFVVNHFDNNVMSMDVLYAINAKKELATHNAPRLTAEPLSVTSSTISIEDLLDLVNQNFPDILPEEVLKHYGYDSRPDGDLGEDALYKLPIGEDTSPRALLANAFEGIVTDDIEKRRLQEYKGKVEMLNAEEQKLRELRAEIKELSFAKGKRDTQKIKDLQFDAIQTANRIATLDKTLLRLEAAAPLQNILEREKKMAYKRAEQKGKEALEAYKKAERERDAKWQSEVKDKYQASKKKAIETRDKREAREKLQKVVLDTVKWITYPSKTDVKCPDILKQPYADFLNNIDLSSQRLAKGGDPTKNDLRLANAMSSLATALDKVLTSQDPTQDTTTVLDTGYLDLPANFVEKLRDMTEEVKAMMGSDEYVVNKMPAEEVRKLTQMIRTLNHAIKEVSTLYANLRFANVEALGDNTMSFVDALGEIEKTGGIKDFAQWDNALPYYAFKRFGEGGESIFEGLMDAQDNLAFLAQKIFDFQEKAWKGKEAKVWSEDTHTIDLPDGDTLTLTTADAMSIYCLSRRQQGLQHLLAGGIRVMGIQKGSKKAKDSRSLLTVKDIDTIISSLTDRQKQVADAIQEFMSTVCSEWGNEISMKRFLTKEFTEKFYFPIESNDENMPTKDPSAQQSDLFRLLNISATKPIDPRANNEVIIRNIFDVFSGHASDMARLNSYGMALLDFMKWLNYREKTVNEEGQINVRGVRKSMEKAFGTAARSYVLNLVKDVNGRPSDGGDPTILMKWMRAAKTAAVGSSFRVATLQFTSYPRAALVLSPKNLALGLTKPPQIKKAKKYCGIALWKSFGFYETNISRSIEEQIKGVKDVKQKLIELSLKGAEWGDALTWGALWNACEYEVAATKQYKVGTEEFNQAVGKKLREVVYSTQVVDSTLTRSQIMRSKRGMAQEAAAFMSEPTVSANILMDAGFQFNAEKRRTGSAKAAWKKTGSYIARAVAVYSVGQLTAALIEGLWDVWRDDDDEEFDEKYWKALKQNLIIDLVPFNKIPIISDVFEAVLAMFDVGFYSSDKMSSTWLTQAVSAVDAWKTVLSGESSTTTYNALYKTVRAISSFYGVSFSGVMREGVDLWNNTAGAYDTTLKIRQYDLSKADIGTELYEAIISGDTNQANSLKAQFEDSDSLSSAIRKALRENDPRIKEAAQAQINGDPSERVRIARQIIADGFTQDDVVRAINAEINAMTSSDSSTSTKKESGFYTTADFAAEIANGDQATAYAAKVDIIQTAQKNGKTEEEAKKSFNSSAKSELKELFLAGEISEQEVINALTSYCDVEQDDAMADVQYWAFKQDYPDVYADDSWFDTYYEKIADSGISIDVYMEYRNTVSTITGEGKKEKRMAAIHSLPIPSYQKDALYYAEGWAESKLHEAPWH